MTVIHAERVTLPNASVAVSRYRCELPGARPVSLTTRVWGFQNGVVMVSCHSGAPVSLCRKMRYVRPSLSRSQLVWNVMRTSPLTREVTDSGNVEPCSRGPCLLGALSGVVKRTRPYCGAPFTPGNSPAYTT